MRLLIIRVTSYRGRCALPALIKRFIFAESLLSLHGTAEMELTHWDVHVKLQLQHHCAKTYTTDLNWAVQISESRQTGRHNHISVFTGKGKKINLVLFKCLFLQGIIFVNFIVHTPLYVHHLTIQKSHNVPKAILDNKRHERQSQKLTSLGTEETY